MALAGYVHDTGLHWRLAEGVMGVVDAMEELDEKIGPNIAEIQDMLEQLDLSEAPHSSRENITRIYNELISSDTKLAFERGNAYHRIKANAAMGEGRKFDALTEYAKAASYAPIIFGEMVATMALFGAAYTIAGIPETVLAFGRAIKSRLH